MSDFGKWLDENEYTEIRVQELKALHETITQMAELIRHGSPLALASAIQLAEPYLRGE